MYATTVITINQNGNEVVRADRAPTSYQDFDYEENVYLTSRADNAAVFEGFC